MRQVGSQVAPPCRALVAPAKTGSLLAEVPVDPLPANHMSRKSKES